MKPSGKSRRPRLATTRNVEPASPAVLAAAFARAVDELSADATFAGIEIVERIAHRAGRACNLTLTLDRQGAVDVFTCERVASHLNRALDRYPQPYTLTVRSAGLDRRLNGPSDYERFRGHAVRARTNVPISGRKTHRGMLAEMRGSTVLLQVEGRPVQIPFEALQALNLEYDVRADLQRAKKERRDARKSR